MNYKTEVNTRELSLESIYNDFVLEYKIIEIETYPEDICFAYQENKSNIGNAYNFFRTILVVDKDSPLDHLYKIINSNPDGIHEISNDKFKQLEQIIYKPYIHLVAQTQQYWDDVRYNSEDRRSYLADEVYQYDRLQVNIFELVRDRFYDRDVLVDICLEETPSKSRLEAAVEIIRKQKVDFSLIKPILIRNSYLNGISKNNFKR